MTSPETSTRFTGKIRRILPMAGSPPTVRIIAEDALGTISEAKISPAALPDNTPSGDVVDAILDAAGWPSGARAVDTGASNLSRWFEDDTFALPALRRVEDSELGFIYTNPDNEIVFEGRHHRLIGDHLTPVAEFSDDPADVAGGALPYLVAGMDESDPIDEIWNEAVATVTPYSVGALAVLWTLTGETPVLAPGQARTWYATVPDDYEFVDAWTTPVVGTDITQTGVANGDIAVSVVKSARRMKVTVTNNGTAAATLTLVRGRGTPVTAGTETVLKSVNAASQTEYGVRSFPHPGPWLRTTNEAQDQTDYLVATYGDPLPFLTIPAIANVDFAGYLALAISDRVTVKATALFTRFGIDRDFFIERIEERLRWGDTIHPHEIKFTLSPAPATDEGVWILGTSELGTGTRLGY